MGVEFGGGILLCSDLLFGKNKQGQPCVVNGLLVDTGDNVPAPQPRQSRAYPQRKSSQDR